jgi:predicted SprT family Zn-dependent metalloprotease
MPAASSPGSSRAAPLPDAPPAPPAASGVPDTQTLHAWADELARRHFGQPFDGRVAWATRLRYRAGDYTPARATIRLSLPYYLRYGPAEARRILLHELCHWWLYRQGMRHRENSACFRELLRQHGAPVRAKPMPRRPAGRIHFYVCPHCGARYRYRRRVDYACGRCCRLWAGGRYDPRFRLVPVAP